MKAYFYMYTCTCNYRSLVSPIPDKSRRKSHPDTCRRDTSSDPGNRHAHKDAEGAPCRSLKHTIKIHSFIHSGYLYSAPSRTWGSLVESTPFVRRVVGSNPALAVT